MKYIYKNTAPKQLLMVANDTDNTRLASWAAERTEATYDDFKTFADANSISYPDTWPEDV